MKIEPIDTLIWQDRFPAMSVMLASPLTAQIPWPAALYKPRLVSDFVQIVPAALSTPSGVETAPAPAEAAS